MSQTVSNSPLDIQETSAQCPLCGYRFPPAEMPERGCRICPMKSHCDALVCPNCGYCMPQTTRVELFLRKWFGWLGKKVLPERDHSENGVKLPLKELRPQEWARIVEVKAASPTTTARLGGMCLLPGIVFQLRQRKPAYVLRVEETIIALEASLAESIWVTPLPPEDVSTELEKGTTRYPLPLANGNGRSA